MMKESKKVKKCKSLANSRKAARERSLANLEKGRRYRFVPGQSGNPSGRPPAIFAKECRDKLAQVVPGDPLERSYARYFADYLAHRGMHGDQGAIIELADRAEGRARQSVEFSDHADPLVELLDEMRKRSELIGPPEGSIPRVDEDDELVQ